MQKETWTNTTFKLIIIIKMIIVEAVEVSHAEAFNIKSVLDYA